MLALIAGGGALPRRIADAQDTAPLICVFEGATPEGLKPDLGFRLETLGSMIAALVDRGVTRVCLCGSIARPAFDPSKLDAATLPLVPRFQDALAAGDDGALRVVISILNDAGLTVVAAQDITPGLMAAPGVLSRKQPDDQMQRDAARAARIHGVMAPLDIGQACVVARGQAYGIETIGGTDHMLASLPARTGTDAAILFKGPKHRQSRLVDMPTIGPDTLRAAHDAGLAGIVIEAEQVILLEPERCAALADELDLVLWSRAPS